jgi:hypothetical protein
MPFSVSRKSISVSPEGISEALQSYLGVVQIDLGAVASHLGVTQTPLGAAENGLGDVTKLSRSPAPRASNAATNTPTIAVTSRQLAACSFFPTYDARSRSDW